MIMNDTTMKKIGISIMVAVSTAASAQTLQSFDPTELAKQRIMPLNALTMPILFQTKTQTKIDYTTVVVAGRGSFPDEYKDAADKLDNRSFQRAQDEFQRRAAIEKLLPYLNELESQIEAATEFLIPATVTVGEYDFNMKRFPVQIRLDGVSKDFQGGFYCSRGGYETDQYRNILQACVKAEDVLTNGSPFQWLSIRESDAAQKFKFLYTSRQIRALLQVRLTGKYESLGSKHLWGRGHLLSQSVYVEHLVPAKSTALYLLNAGTEELLYTLLPSASEESKTLATIGMQKPATTQTMTKQPLKIKLD